MVDHRPWQEAEKEGLFKEGLCSHRVEADV